MRAALAMIMAAVVAVAFPGSARAACTFEVADLPDAVNIVWTPEQLAAYHAISDAVSTSAWHVTIGMSNSRQVFGGMRWHLRNDPDVLPDLDDRLILGAQGGKAVTEWAEDDAPWEKLASIMASKGAVAADVEILTAILTLRGRWDDPIAAHLAEFEQKYLMVLARAMATFPNLRLVHILENYGGRYDVGQDKTPEPHGFEKQAVLQKIQNEWAGPVPVFALTLWSGDEPRPWDGFFLACEDMTTAGVHLDGKVASRKVGGQLLALFKAISPSWLMP